MFSPSTRSSTSRTNSTSSASEPSCNWHWQPRFPRVRLVSRTRPLTLDGSNRILRPIALNRTAVGFGAGDTTFGWRFYPRLQTPPTQATVRRFSGTLINGGPTADFDSKNLQIEPGQRECYAMMVVPNFVPTMKMTTVTNWFDLKTSHPEEELETTDMVHLGRKLQTARSAMQRLCDSGRYRPADLESLGDRLDQARGDAADPEPPVTLPFEADLTGLGDLQLQQRRTGPPAVDLVWRARGSRREYSHHGVGL